MRFLLNNNLIKIKDKKRNQKHQEVDILFATPWQEMLYSHFLFELAEWKLCVLCSNQ